MARTFVKGYFVKGVFVAEGSPLDIELKAQLKGTDAQSRTDLKKESDALQKLGVGLVDLSASRLEKLKLGDKMMDAIQEAKRITNFEGKRRQMQFIGKLMRGMEPELLLAVRATLADQHGASAAEAQSLHEAESWRDKLIADDKALEQWFLAFPETDLQQLRTLVRQARKDAQATEKEENAGATVRHGRAYREIFQLVREALG